MTEILLHVGDSPHRTALAFGIGVWIALFPIWGIHTAMALGIAFLFRLNRAAMLVGAWVNNPWTLAPLYLSGTILGCGLLGVSTEGLASIDWGLKGLADSLRPFLWPFVLGNTVLGILGGVVGYFALRLILEKRQQQQTPASA